MAKQADYEFQIGSIVVSASLLEHILRSGISKIIGEKFGDLVASAQMPFHNVTALFSSLYTAEATTEDDAEKVERLCKKINSVIEMRNKYAHSVWYRTEGYEGVREKLKNLKLGKSPGYHIEEVSLEDLEQLALDMEVYIFRLLDIIHPGWNSK